MEEGLWIFLNVLLVMFLVFLNGFFVATEFALVKVRGSRLDELIAAGNPRAKIARHVVSRLDGYLSACQLGITLASLGLGWVGEPAVAHLIVEPVLKTLHAPEYLISPVSFGIAFGIITFLHIVLGELAPKSLAIFKAEGTSLWVSGPIMLFYRLSYPAIWLLNGSANLMLSWFGIRPASEQEAGHTEEEIRILMKESQKNGFIDENDLNLVENVFEFNDRIAREVMIPRTMMECVYTNLSFQENMEIIMKSKHTRYPVANEDKDHIIGVVHVTDMYNAALTMNHEEVDIQSLIRPVPHVPESTEISAVLQTMQQNRVQMIVIVDEFGGTAGLVTLEDIIEEIVGDIQDEIKSERPEFEIEKNATSLDGRILLEKVNELFGIRIDEDDVDTLGGWIYSQIEGDPKEGQRVVHEDIVFEITEVDHLRIQRVKAHALPRFNEEEEEEREAI